jgi:cell division septation protein DedD
MALTKQARVIGISVATAAVVGAGTVAAFSAGASSNSAGNVTATFAKTSDWGSGFQGQYTVTNSSGANVHGWTVSFDLPAGENVSSLWNGTMATAGQHITVTNPSWSTDVAPGSSASFGFVVDTTGATADPQNCLLNNTPCGGGPVVTPSGTPSTVPSPSSSATVPPTTPPTSKPTTPPTSHPTSKPPTTPPTSPPTSPPVTAGSYAFAPYVDTGQRQDLGALAKAAGAKNVTAAFVLSSGSGCTGAWNGTTDPTFTANLKAGLADLRANGGDAIASFGGANGTELAQACTDVNSLKTAYKQVIDTYGFSHVDFDIEGGATTDTASIDRRSQALAQLQGEYSAQGKTLTVSLTLPVLPQGLTQDGVNIVSSAARNSLKLGVVNVMAMDYGAWAAPSPAGKMGDYADQSAQSTHDQLKTIYPALSDAELWKMVGITPMIGVNDTQGETFTVADAQVVAAFAAQHHVGRVAMWSLTRDTQCSGGAETWADATCSSILQSPYAFSHAFETFTG